MKVRRLRLPGFSDSRHMNVARLSALPAGCLYPRGNPWCLFLLEAERTPGLINADRRIRSLEKIQRAHRESNPRSPSLCCINSPYCFTARPPPGLLTPYMLLYTPMFHRNMSYIDVVAFRKGATVKTAFVGIAVPGNECLTH